MKDLPLQLRDAILQREQLNLLCHDAHNGSCSRTPKGNERGARRLRALLGLCKASGQGGTQAFQGLKRVLSWRWFSAAQETLK